MILSSPGAGDFLYIAVSDQIPETRKSRRLAHPAMHFGPFLLGPGLMLALARWSGDV